MLYYKHEEFADLNRYVEYIKSEREDLEESIEAYNDMIERIQSKVRTIDMILSSIQSYTTL